MSKDLDVNDLSEAQDPLQSQAAWVKRRRMEVDQIAASTDMRSRGQPDAHLPAEAKKALANLGKLVS